MEAESFFLKSRSILNKIKTTHEYLSDFLSKVAMFSSFDEKNERKTCQSIPLPKKYNPAVVLLLHHNLTELKYSLKCCLLMERTYTLKIMAGK